MKKAFFAALFAAIMIASCGGEKPAEPAATPAKETAEKDSMIYGLSCDGTNDSVIVLLPFVTGADPVTYNIEVAKANGKVIGQSQIGDWVGVMLNPEDTTEAMMVINLDQLKATWTYEVRPTWKDASKLSARALRRKLGEIPDSMKEAYLVPREYGFTLKRSSVAQPVGRVMRATSLEDDSPVEYPPVKNYTSWKCRNGHLYLTSTEGTTPIAKTSESDGKAANAPKPKETVDTLEFVMMTQDSLVLKRHNNDVISFHRKENASVANAAAQKAAVKTSSEKIK